MQQASDESDRVISPFAVAVRAVAAVFAGLAVPATALLIGHWGLIEHAAWWAMGLVAAVIVVACFACTYLGARIGARRADGVLVLIVFAILASALVLLSRYTR
jgi:hypothetical protein